MENTINITCFGCRKDFIIEPYYCNTEILVHEDAKDNYRRYIARTVATAICPNCGETNGQVCESEVHKRDIVALAIRRYKR